MDTKEAKKVVLEIRRKAWLKEHGRDESAVMKDGGGEYICADSKQVKKHIFCEMKVYLPMDISI